MKLYLLMIIVLTEQIKIIKVSKDKNFVKLVQHGKKEGLGTRLTLGI